MTETNVPPRRLYCSLWFLLWLFPALAWGQAKPAPLSGQVLDPSGAAVPAITVSVVGPSGASLVAQTDDQGRYSFRNLPPGTYRLEIKLKGFADFVKEGIVVSPGHPQVVDAHLQVAMETQQVTVTEESAKVSVNPTENTSQLVLKGKDIESLSDDPDELQDELQALAGPAAGPNGGQIYIDGFTGGQLPPKSSIREIRINQNPFSAQYDTLGYGRIEILTKPGTDKLHGQFFFSGNDSAFNTRNPFATEIPAYHTLLFDGNFGGPLGKKSSFFLDGQRRNIQDAAIVDAVVLGSNFQPTNVSPSVLTPETRTNFSPRFDTQIGKNNTLSVRYQVWKDSEDNQGIGQFSLPSTGYNTHNSDQSIQFSNAQVLSEKAVTELRFRYRRSTSSQLPASLQPTIAVLGAFTSGGSSQGTILDTQDYYEGQNYSSVSLNKNFLKFGARLRDEVDSNTTMSFFNGDFTFPSIQAYQTTEQGLAAGLTPAQIRAAGGGPNQFKLVTGIPHLHVQYLDFEPYVEDDWKARPNLNVSAGLRLETQNHISDHADFAPRLGIAWGIGKGKTPKVVLRAGSGVFYDRFQETNILNALALNGVNQLQYIVNYPEFFPNIPPVSTLTQVAEAPTIYQIAPNLRAPYTIQSGVGLERQLAKNVTASVTYLNTHGVHEFLSRNINAPLCAPTDSTCSPATAPRPLGGETGIYQYESAGLYNQNQMIANFNIRGSKVSLSGYYTLSFADSDTNGASSFPMDQYDLALDYGRAPWDVRHRVFFGGSWNLPRGFQLFPFMIANSAHPFNITVSPDLFDDTIFNARPTFATDLSRPSVVVTRWGAFDTDPIPGQKFIPPYYGDGFGQVTVNLRLSKTFGFGKEVAHSGGPGGGGGRGGWRGRGLGGQGLSSGGGGGMFNAGNMTNRRYNLTFSIAARNLFNNVNLGLPVGNLNSPLFGQANGIAGFFGYGAGGAANRRIDFQVRFAF